MKKKLRIRRRRGYRFELSPPHNVFAKRKYEGRCRTVREFVEDLLSNGRTSKEVLIIAKNTQWASNIEEIILILKSFSKNLKKRFQIIDKKDDNKI